MSIKPRFFLSAYLLLPTIAAIFAVANLVSIPSDSQNALLFGLSASRLLIAGILVLAAAGSIFLSIYAFLHSSQCFGWIKAKLDSTRFLISAAIFTGTLFLFASIFLAIPDKYMGAFWAIEQRLHPIVVWALFVSLQVLIGLLGWQIKKKDDVVSSLKSIAAPFGILLGLLLAVWAFIAVTRLGLTGGNSFWSKAGVPILWPQTFLALLIALSLQLLLTRFSRISTQQLWLDLGLCALIWLAAVILWSNQNYVPGVFNTPARPPTNEIYPINDSLIFDRDAQKLLIGQELMYDAQDKPVFIFFLAILHLLTGNSFSNFYLLQILFFAFIPILGYFLGKSLHSRPLGAMFAILLVIKEQNAIALTNYIHVSTSKMILSEMLTTFGVLLFALLLVRWLKNPVQANSNLWLAGGVLGLTNLVRLNSIGILPITILVIGLALKPKWKSWLTISFLFSVFMLVSAIPWLIRSTVETGNPLSFITSKTGGVLVNQRYNPLIEQTAPSNNKPTTTVPEANTSKLGKYFVLGQGMATNYLHNLIGITVMLPPSLELYTLLDEVRLPYWKMDWDGSLLPGAFWIILTVLLLVALGIASSWKRWKFAGLAPLAVVLGYNLVNAASLTSGGRYLVPMDWGALFYFSIGLFDITLWILGLFGWPQNDSEIDPMPITQQKGKTIPLLAFGLLFLFLGVLPVLMENIPAKRYPDSVTIADFLKNNQSIPEISASGTAENLASLSKDHLALVLYGRALYPRYFGKNKGDGATLAEDPLIGSASFDHLSFYLIGSEVDRAIVLPTSDNISPAIAGADTWVVGCWRDNHLEAEIVVFRANDNVQVYQQEPFEITCQQ